MAHLDTAHWLVNNAAIFARELALRDRRGVAIDSHKFIQINRAIETADYATLLGNDFDFDSYAFAGKPVFQVPNPSAVTYPLGRGQGLRRGRAAASSGSAARGWCTRASTWCSRPSRGCPTCT